MSQQTNFEEEQQGYHGTYSPPPNPQSGYYQYYEPHGKLGQTHIERSPTAGQRLALAIVSVIVLIPMVGILLGNDSVDSFILVGRLVGLGLVCLTLIIINLVVNLRR